MNYILFNQKILISFLSLSVFTTVFSASAQVPNYFENNPKWRLSSSCNIGGGDCIENQEYVYYISGDSIVDSLSYHKVFRRGKFSESWFASEPTPSWCNGSSIFNVFYILIRQEGKKIYTRNEYDEVDQLLYNFNLNIGDTLPITSNQLYDNIIVSSIDSILVGNHYRKVFNLSGFDPHILIEGIGHEAGFFELFPPTLECASYLSCFTLNDTTFYPEFGSPCDLSVDIYEVINHQPFKVYPNPTNSFLIVDSNKPINKNHISIFNGTGQQLNVSFHQNTQNKITIDISQLSKGLYIAQYNDKINKPIRIKVVKE
jgi:hypothetical protein